MIKKEYYKTREDGVKLYRTYSDTGHKIKRVSDGITYGDAIDVSENVEYEEADEYIDPEESYSYEEILGVAEKSDSITKKINLLNLSNNEALSVKWLYPKWEDKIDSIIEAGFITLYDGNLWRARQTHTALEIYPPSMNTDSLYEVIVEEHEGTMEDSIPYTPPMEIFEGKYYTQLGVLYKCTKSSGTALVHNLFDLRGLYVELIEK